MASILGLCESHLSVESEAAAHYRNVCRALVSEALELSFFLKKTLVRAEEHSEELQQLALKDWVSTQCLKISWFLPIFKKSCEMGPFSLILKHSAKFDTTTELPAQWFVGAFLEPWTGHALFQLKQQLCSRLNCRRCSAIVVLGTTDNLSWLICFLRNCKVLFLMIKCTSLVKNSNTWFSRGGAACLSGTFLYTSPLLMFLAWCHLQGEQFTHHLKEPIGLDHDFTSN